VPEVLMHKLGNQYSSQ